MKLLPMFDFYCNLCEKTVTPEEYEQCEKCQEAREEGFIDDQQEGDEDAL